MIREVVDSTRILALRNVVTSRPDWLCASRTIAATATQALQIDDAGLQVLPEGFVIEYCLAE
jgi:hypothetical protein